MTRAEIIIPECVCVRACFVPFFFFFWFNSMKTWVVSLNYRGGHRFPVAEYCIYFSEDQSV